MARNRRIPATWARLPLVEVVWIDAALSGEDSGDLEQPASAAKFGGLAVCSDVGYLIRKDKKVIVLSVGVCRDDQTYRHSNTIPRGWVKEIVLLDRVPSASSSQPSDGPPSSASSPSSEKKLDPTTK